MSLFLFLHMNPGPNVGGTGPGTQGSVWDMVPNFPRQGEVCRPPQRAKRERGSFGDLTHDIMSPEEGGWSSKSAVCAVPEA